MPKLDNPGKTALKVISSGRLAIILVLFLIILAVAGAILPQEGKVEPSDIHNWQQERSALSSLFRPLGLFGVFHSVPFMATLVLLALNTLACTLQCLFQPRSPFNWRKMKAPRVSGFLGLHTSLLLLIAGGFYSGAAWMDGYLVLTEGQSLEENAGSYVMLAKGPLMKKEHQGFLIRLREVTDSYDSQNMLAEASVRLEFESSDGRTEEDTVRVNYPVSFFNVDFTLDETGFSPRLGIREQGSERPLVDSFLALKTFRQGRERDYRDFLSLPFLDQKIFMRFLPDSKKGGNRPIKTGDKPGNPLLHLWTENDGGVIMEEGLVHPGEATSLAGFEFTFSGFRRWAGFRVVRDPGYAWVVGALWLGMGSLVLRYIPDLKAWFSPQSSMMETIGGKKENDVS